MNKRLLIYLSLVAMLFSCTDNGSAERKKLAILGVVGNMDPDVSIEADSTSSSVTNLSEKTSSAGFDSTPVAVAVRTVTTTQESGEANTVGYTASVELKDEVVPCRKGGKLTINGSHDLKIVAYQDADNKQFSVSNLKRTIEFDNCRNGAAITIVKGKLEVIQTNEAENDTTYWTSCRGQSGFQPENANCPDDLGRNLIMQSLVNLKTTVKTLEGEPLELKKSRGRKAKVATLELDQTNHVEKRSVKYNVYANENSVKTLSFDGMVLRKGKVKGIIKVNGSLFTVDKPTTETETEE
jgi:hypothetical protein